MKYLKRDQAIQENSPLNIVMLGHKRVPSREGGVEVVVEELSTRMARLGHHVTCLNRGGHHVCGKEFDAQPIQEYGGVKLRTVFTIDQKGLAAVTSSFFGALQAALDRYEIVHIHAEGPCAMLWLPKLAGKRCIATIHGLDHRRAKWGRWAAKYLLFGEKIAVRFADEIIVLSRDVQRYFWERYGRQTTFIPNGVSKPDHRPADQITARFGLEKDNYILFLGRLVPEKGIQYLLSAYRQVRSDKKLVIAGGSSDSAPQFLQMLQQMGQRDDRVIFTGFVQGHLLEELYSNAYLYVLPSDLEGMPLGLLEAMSYGNCCLVSDIPECADVVANHGILFRKGSIEDLKAKLQGLCNDPEQVRQMRTGVSGFICTRYDWDNVVEETLALYRGEKRQAEYCQE